MAGMMRLFALLALMFVSGSLLADAPATAPATQPQVVSAGDTQAIAQLQKQSADSKTAPVVTIQGTVSDASASDTGKVFRAYFKEADEAGKNGVHFVYFPKNGLFTAMENKFGGKAGSGLKGKKVAVTGKLTLFKDRPQIVVTNADQVKVIE